MTRIRIVLSSMIVYFAVTLVFIAFNPAIAQAGNGGVELKMDSPSPFDKQLYFKVVHPQNVGEVRLITDYTVTTILKPASDVTESTFTVSGDMKSHEYRAIVYGTDGAEIGESAIVAFDGSQYQPKSPTWNFKEDEVVLTGRMNVNG
ncbi:MAG: hypothetical protein HY779_03490, partial [Rubrobacteridae bacterium]|nr:hypothetical protein [Rubrobacteridae bacterium]